MQNKQSKMILIFIDFINFLLSNIPLAINRCNDKVLLPQYNVKELGNGVFQLIAVTLDILILSHGFV